MNQQKIKITILHHAVKANKNEIYPQIAGVLNERIKAVATINQAFKFFKIMLFKF